MIWITTTDDVRTWKSKTGYSWFRQADGITFQAGPFPPFSGPKRPWSHFWFRKWRWGKMGFYPILVSYDVSEPWPTARLNSEFWTRHPFESQGQLWWHGGKYPILSFKEDWNDRLVYKAVMLFNKFYKKLRG